MEVKVECKYNSTSHHLLGKHQGCFVQKFDLISVNKNKAFKFSGSNEEKLETTKICFESCRKIDFIPPDIFIQFPNLNGVSIWNSDLSSSIANLFTKEFKKIEYVLLFNTKIKEIEENAFTELKELKWIDLNYNKIENMNHEIFKNNLKLEYVYLNGNNIKMINPKLFSNLDHLQKVKINSVSLTTSDVKNINDNLKSCYDNHLNDKITLKREELDHLKFKNLELSIINIKNLKKLNFVRCKYEFRIKELEDLKANFTSKINFIIKKEKEVRMMKENYDIIRNSYADNQILEAHRHILEGEF
jgi:Leucine-rich repeat (LRR) protein